MLTPTYSCHTPPAVPEYSAIALAGLGMRQPNQRGGVPKAHLAGGRGAGVGRRGHTLSDEGLAGVQEDLTAFDDHALNGQVFSDVLCFAYFIMHYPVGTGKDSQRRAASIPQTRPRKKAWHPGFPDGACGHEAGERGHLGSARCGCARYRHDLFIL